MVLLIPDAVRKIKAQGREEGREEGVAEERQRVGQVLAELGLHDGNGAPIILDSDAVNKILHGDAPEKP